MGIHMRHLAAALITAAALSIGLAQVASAADVPVKAPVYKAPPVVVVYDWTGFYLGAHIGGVWGTKDWTDVTGGVSISEGSHDFSGFLAGGQFGFNYQIDRLVLGWETQFSWTDANGEHVFTTTPNTSGRTDVNWLGTSALRLGYAMDRALFFVKAGGAWVNEDFSLFGNPGGVTFADAGSQTRFGWMLGTGLEFAFWQNWSAKIEYDYMHFGTDSFDFNFVPGGAFCCTFDIDQDMHVVKFGINYRFGYAAPVVARY